MYCMLPSTTSACHHCIICSFYLAKQHHAFELLVNGNIAHVCISNMYVSQLLEVTDFYITGSHNNVETLFNYKNCLELKVLQVPVKGDEQAHSSTLMAFFVD